MLAALIFFLVCVGLSVTGHADLIPDTGYGGSSDNCYGRC
jgi:hypothetical protein